MATLESLKEEMIQEAKDKYGKIFLCTKVKSFSDSFSIIEFKCGQSIAFWFNSSDNSTHLIKKELPIWIKE